MHKRYVSLMTKVNRMFGIVIVLTCGILSLFSYQLNLQAHLSELTSQNIVLLRTMAQSIDTQLAQVELIAREMAYDEDVISLLRGKSLPQQILSISFSVGSKLQRNESYFSVLASDMLLLSVDDTMLESYDTLVHESRLADDASYAAFLESPCLSSWGSPKKKLFPSNSNEIVLPYYHKVITGLNTRIGTVRCTAQVDKLFAPLSEYGGTLMVLRGDELLYAMEPSPEAPQQRQTGSWREGSRLYFSTPLDSLNAELVLMEPFDQVRAVAMQDFALSVLTIFLAGIIFLLITRRIVRAMLSRLHRLTQAVSAIPQGRYAVLLPEDAPDEVGQLSRAFSTLLEQANTYYNELLQKEKDKRHAQTMALQYQLNPHFLFNSLYWLQLQMEERGIDPALTASIEQLGQVLHYNMLGSRLALLSEEEEHVRAYVGFVGAMKENHIRLTIDMPDAMGDARILRFTLQPLLENAIQHGYVAGQDLHIHIAFRVDTREDLFEIAVHNDGSQISADQLAALQEHLDAAALDGLPVADQKSGHGTALSNLSRRLALTYGTVAGIWVTSGDGDTCVRILLPLSQCMRKENHRENADR